MRAGVISCLIQVAAGGGDREPAVRGSCVPAQKGGRDCAGPTDRGGLVGPLQGQLGPPCHGRVAVLGAWVTHAVPNFWCISLPASCVQQVFYATIVMTFA